MTDHPNPYASPQARLEEAPSAARRAVYSPTQGAVGTFLGGPLAAVRYLSVNYAALEQPQRVRATLAWGLAISLAFLLLFPFIPDRVPRLLFPLVMSWAARLLIEKGQFSKEAIATSDRFRFQSNWRVAGVSLLGTLVFLALAFAVITLYFMWGWIPEA